MKSLKLRSLWALPLLFMVWKTTEMPESSKQLFDAGRAACPPLACEDTLFVRLHDPCEIRLTNDLVLKGYLPDCYPDAIIEVITPANVSLGNTVPATYANEVLVYKVTDPPTGQVCTGWLKLQDAAPPALSCPADAARAINTAYANVLQGELDYDDPVFFRRDFSCWLSALTPDPGHFFFDTIAFQVAAPGIYTFVLFTDFTQSNIGAGAIFQGDFYPYNPCQNIVAFSEGQSLLNELPEWWAQLPDIATQLPWLVGTAQPFIRLELELRPEETYQLVTTSLRKGDTGRYAWLVLRDEVTEPAGDILLDREVYQLPWITDLVCQDAERIFIETPLCYYLDGDGNFVFIDEFTEYLLRITGFPHQGLPWWSRGGSVQDLCAQLVEICLQDKRIQHGGTCGETLLERTFTATDEAGNTVSCVQFIRIRKPGIKDVVLPNYTAYLECDEEFPLDSLGNPHPNVTGYPFVRTAFGFINLSEPYCNLAATYTDKSRVDVCEQGYKFVREWTIYDWCAPGTTTLYRQLIKIGDFTPPLVFCPTPLDSNHCIPTFYTGPFACEAIVTIPMPDSIADNCSANWSIQTEIIIHKKEPIYDTYGALIGYVLLDSVLVRNRQVGDLVTKVPKGLHRFRYRVTDDCENVSLKDCWFEVIDKSEPVAQCNEYLNISLSRTENGVVRIFAKDLDEGSYDNCGAVRIEVRREVPSACADEFRALTGLTLVAENGILYTPWAAHIEITCCDIAQPFRTQVRIHDDANGDGIPGNTIESYGYCQKRLSDNYNICWLEITVEDKLRPTCKAPLDVTLSCADTRVNRLLNKDISCADSTLLNSLFGEFQASDNCEAHIVCDTVIDQRNNCGVGTITRIAYAQDGSGNRSIGTCQQVITITADHSYEIIFPADVSGDCEPALDTVIGLQTFGCDLLGVSVVDERFAGTSGECFKVLRTFRLLNWCEYNNSAPPIIISRDEDCNGIPGDLPVHVLRRFGPGNQQPAFIDLNRLENDDKPAAGLKRTTCDGSTNPSGYWRRSNSVGFWQYTQEIRIFDKKAPRVVVSPMDRFCATAPNCVADVGISFVVVEDCTPDDLRFSVRIDLFNDSIGEFTQERQRIRGVYPKFTFEDTFPIGEHRVEIQVRDACGNVSGESVVINVEDCEAPAPICINGLAVSLMPDGDGGGAMAVWATDFIASPSSDCSGEVTYSINRPGERPDPTKKGLLLTCADAGRSIPVEIFAWDNAFNPQAVQPNGSRGGRNYDKCVTYVLVREADICRPEIPGNIAGLIATENGQPLPDALVRVSGKSDGQTRSDAVGNYALQVDFKPPFHYTITPELDENHLAGITTYDIILISQHILGIRPLQSPYQIIAADANNSRSVSMLDVIQLRKLILHQDVRFPQNKSWRFVNKNYNFPNPMNPWQELFPESISFSDLSMLGSERHDFIAIKIGDVNGNALPGRSFMPSSNASWKIMAEAPPIRAGELCRIVLRADMAQILGCQFALTFDKNMLEFVQPLYGLADASHVGLNSVSEGVITVSWDTWSRGTANDLLTLEFRSKIDGNALEALRLDPRYLAPEAYSFHGDIRTIALQGALQAQAAFQLNQNSPNPFREETTIRFHLPTATNATLQIFSVEGRLVKQIQQHFAEGWQEIPIAKHDLPGGGMYYYRLEAQGQQGLKRMLFVD